MIPEFDPRYPEFDFSSGNRVLLLSQRTKDGFEKSKSKPFITYSKNEFDDKFGELYINKLDGERIYCSASSLDFIKAKKKFRKNQLEAELSGQDDNFYMNLQNKWVSALMKSPENKIWMMDCDSQKQVDSFLLFLDAFNLEDWVINAYDTPNGKHYLMNAFNKKYFHDNNFEFFDLEKSLSTNAFMLLAY